MASPLLFTPLKLRNVVFRNRLGVSSMCQYKAVNGVPNEWHTSHLTARAIGGAGLVMAEATGVSPEGRISPACTGLWNDEQTQAWKNITTQIKSYGAVAGIQIGHAGRKASTNVPWVENGGSVKEGEGAWQTVAPSAIAYGTNITHVPKELSIQEIVAIEDAFVASATRALEAGFQVLELHGAHGYLVDQFLSPLSNKRTDEYGGSFEGRNRIFLNIVKKVRKVWPEELPLFVRLSCTDWVDGGKDIEESVRTSKLLKEEGVDLVDCSSGFVVPESFNGMKFAPGFQTPFSERIRKDANIPTAAVGIITSGKQAEEVLQAGKADFILCGTQFLRDPFFAYHAAQEVGVPQSECAKMLPTQTGFWLSKRG